MARQTISAGSAPLVWSNVSNAFEKINNNFSELYATVGGGNPVDFTALQTPLIPDTNGAFNLGSLTKRWKELYLSSEGIIIGSAAIRSDGYVLDLPAGSRVGGKLINDPADVGFGTVSVAGQDDVVADTVTASLNLVGSGINITTDAASDTVTFTNTGVLDITTGTGISVSGGSTKNIVNTGVTSASPGLGIGVDVSTGPITITNNGIVEIEGGPGITVGARSPITGRVIITNSAPFTGISVYRDIRVNGTTISAQNAADLVEFVDGPGIDMSIVGAVGLTPTQVTINNTGVTGLLTSGNGIITSGSTGTVTLSFDNEIDIVGSVFSDNSTLLIDGVAGKIVGPIETNSTILASNGIVTNEINRTDGGNIQILAAAGGNLTLGGTLVTISGLVSAPSGITANITGDTVGYHTGDVKGSIFGDNSSVLVDAIDNKVLADVVNSETVTNSLITGKVEETFETKSGATGTVEHDCSATHIFVHSSLSNNFTANFTNLELESGKATSLTLILNQGGSAYIPTAVQIGGLVQTIQWQGSTPPSGNNGKTDIVSFTVINDNGSYYVYGQLTSFGT